MNSWNSGYLSEIDYTHGYYREISPVFLSLALLHRGVKQNATHPPRYLELGFGQGLSVNIHAAACPGEFWGTDFNPAQATNAKELAIASGSDAKVFDASFAELAARADLPEFDIITLHGIWSWISEENRTAIVDLARRKLAVGGILYLSYNCTPGWSPAMPLRHLMTLHAEFSGADDQGITGKIDGALSFAQRVVDSGAVYFRANPGVADRLSNISKQNRRYLAHEYFNRDWAPLPFSQVAEKLADAKLDFAASSNLLEHMDSVNLTKEGQTLLAGIAHPIFRESVRDYVLNQQFRRDIYVRGRRQMTAFEQLEQYKLQRFVLLKAADKIALKANGPAGEITMQEEVYKPLIEILASRNYEPKSVAEIVAHPSWKSRSLTTAIEVLIVLTATGQANPTQSEEVINQARPKCAALNAHICQRALFEGEIGYLASPVIGGGVSVDRLEQLFLLAREAGHSNAKAWASCAWDALDSQGQRVLRDGKPLAKAEENMAELRERAKVFEADRLPILSALGII
jgi:hypothetical protein